jgi:Zn-dependent protease
MLADLSLSVIVQRIIGAMVVAAFHGFTLAWIARLLGDRTPAHDGRLTLMPFRHFSLLGVASGIATRAGWIDFMDIDPAQLRWGRGGLVVCVLASLLLLVAFGVAVLRLRLAVLGIVDPNQANYVIAGMTTIGEMALCYAVLNLLPLPPLTGGHLLAALRPDWAKAVLRHILWVSIGLAVLMVVTRGSWLDPAIRALRAVTG